ncbi:sulfite exporter TauE/SafE [Mobilisporobacter senegalensis]|uniref:Sulfite exporter TauE/SafE n=1 Tax=Mobilisporobacter senegalensis TaxID=1329262 RepID=A0A3N1XW89_9FIRM|nr:sulfite exporter TauE/SafE family protein [Mobilisporobacter senegalensis]ROR30471.1 sulfite exporter TauE/SafE [Mobilisporobacter senegalensis]
MSEKNVIRILEIDGMTCISCENRIEKKLKNTKGIVDADVNYKTGKAKICFNYEEITLEEIRSIIEGLDYKVVRGNRTVKNENTILQIIPAAIILFSLYTIINRLGGFNIINAFPVAKEGMGYAMLFVIGLLTSVHCVAMCGGISLSQCVPHNATTGGNKSKFQTLRPTFLYNLGRVISYTVVGGIVGALGSVISFSGAAKGIVQLVAGLFMMIMGLNMLNIFPWLRKLNPHMPKIFAEKINEGKKNNGPLYIGLLNGLMPCGPLQAMQIYALSTGSLIEGAASMFLFSLGTVPLMFGFGALSSFLSQKFTHKMIKVSAVLVVILGVFMFGNGMNLSGISLPSISGVAKGNNSNSNSAGSNVARIVDGVQEVTSSLASGRYEPITVQKGIPVKWTIKAEERDINGCNYSIVIPKLDQQYQLNPGDNVIEFTPAESGTIPYSCWMGMIRSSITVVDDINDIDVTESNTAPDTDISESYKIPTDNVAIAQINDGIQTVKIDMDDTGFQPAIVVLQAGIETTMTINATKISESNSILGFPIYYAQINMKEGENPISLIPDVDFDFSAIDASFSAYVKVVDDISNIDIEAIKEEVKNYEPTDQDFLNNFVGDGVSCH